MIILNISFRTDIVACYTDWLVERLLHSNYIGTRNPQFPNKILMFNTKAIDKIVFCSKDYSKLLPYIQEINQKYDCQYHYTITPYLNDIEVNVPDVFDSMKTLRTLSKFVGKEKVIWRYDPILLTHKYCPSFHVSCFMGMANILSPCVRLCTFSFVHKYERTIHNCPEILSPDNKIKKYIVSNMSEIANKNNLYLQTCRGLPEYKEWGVHVEGCLTPKMLEVNVKPDNTKALIPGCMCNIHTYGIGDYHTCKLGCKYCYATRDHSNIEDKNYIDSPLLIGYPTKEDKIIYYESEKNKQLSLW